MKKLSAICLVAIMTLLTQSKSFACSVAINQDAEKTAMIQAIANHYSLPVSAIKKEDLSKVGFSFLAGLGADCSGLENAVLSSGFDFTIKKVLQSCRYRGVVIHKESDGPTTFYMNAENAACSSIALPILPILPRIPRL